MKLKSKCITITSEENIVTDKLKDTNYKIKDRQNQILKLQKQIDTHEKKNSLEKNYTYLRTQVSGLQEQIGKLDTLVQELLYRKNELHKQKNQLKIIYSYLVMKHHKIKLLPNVVRGHQTEHQNPRKRPFHELITEMSKSSQPNEDIYTELSTKQSRYSKYQIDEFDNDAYDKYRKFKKREYMKQKRLSNGYRQKENLKQRERDAQRRSSS